MTAAGPIQSKPTVPRLKLLGLTAVIAVVMSTAVAHAETVTGTSRDPARDVMAADSSVGRVKRDSVDIRKVAYVIGDRRITITTTVVDLKTFAGLNQFVETRVTGDRASVTLSTEVGRDAVKVFTGSALFSCRGSSASADFAQNTIRQIVPRRCLAQSDVLSFRSRTSLNRPNAAEVAIDRAVGTEEFFVGTMRAVSDRPAVGFHR